MYDDDDDDSDARVHQNTANPNRRQRAPRIIIMVVHVIRSASRGNNKHACQMGHTVERDT
jgi:hypothetical protein